MLRHPGIRLVLTLLAACTTLLLIHASASHADGPDLPEGLQAFFARFRSSAQAADAGAIIPLVHPASRACAGDEGHVARVVEQAERVFGHDLAVREMKWRPTDPETFAATKKRVAERRGTRFPVDPEGSLQITWETPANRARVANLLVARVQGLWLWVQVCRN